MSQAAAETARVFFALWPDAAVRQKLHTLSGQLHALRGGRRTRPETLHLTLLFIGAIERARLPDLQAVAATVRVPAFDVAFDRVDCWRHNRIAHLGASAPASGLLDLVAGLENVVAAMGIPFDQRPYKAHITLVRHADCRSSDPEIEPLVWSAREFVLVESRLDTAGASYAERGRWPLVTAPV